MKEKIKTLKVQHKDCVDKMNAIMTASGDTLNAEQQKSFDDLHVKAEGFKTQIENCEKVIAQQTAADKPAASLGRQTPADTILLDDPGKGPADTAGRIVIPASVDRFAGNLQCFKGPNATQLAMKVGMWLAAAICGHRGAIGFCNKHGISPQYQELDKNDIESLHSEGVNTSGGYVVFPEMETAIIRMVEAFGLARSKLKNVPMMSDTKYQPRRTGGLTAYFIGEGDDATESTGSWDLVKLIAKKLAAIATASNELVSDAIVRIADEFVFEIALAFATKEDLCAFQGDGTSTYGGIQGFINKLSALNGVDEGGGLVLASGNAYSEIVDGDLLKMIGRVPNYPGMRPEWTCSKTFWATVMLKLLRAAGGATIAELSGTQRPLFAGFPVNWTSGVTAMPVTEANSQIACLFGDMSMAGTFGDRQGMTIAMSTEATVGTRKLFQSDSFAIRGIERFDINIHDVGTASAAGAVVGLITAAS